KRADVEAERTRRFEHVRALGDGDALTIDRESDSLLAHLSHSPPIMLIMPKIGTTSAMRWLWISWPAVDRWTNDGDRQYALYGRPVPSATMKKPTSPLPPSTNEYASPGGTRMPSMMCLKWR